MQCIYTATVGRSGSAFLAAAFNRFGKNCIAEHEPPDLLLRRLGQRRFFLERGWLGPESRLARFGRDLQRRTIASDEMMGRGRALEWYDRGDEQHLLRLARRRQARLRGFERRGFRHYIEVSQFFLQTFCHATVKLNPDLGLIKLTRNPLECARSLANRDKRLFSNSLPPDRPSNLFRIRQWQNLSPFQIYVHHWIEGEARYYDFVARYGIRRRFEIWTHELTDPDRLAALFEYLGIAHRPFDELVPTNTNRLPTQVSGRDVGEFREVIGLLPQDLAARIPSLAAFTCNAATA